MKMKADGKIWEVIVIPTGMAFTARKSKGDQQTVAKSDDGLCEAPWLKGKRVFLRDQRSEKQRLETQIHEYSHAADWAKSEEFVNEFAHNLANFLHKMGWRCTEPPEDLQPVTKPPETLPG